MEPPKKLNEACLIALDVLIDKQEDSWAVLSNIFKKTWSREDAIVVCQEAAGLEAAIKELERVRVLNIQKWEEYLVHQVRHPQESGAPWFSDEEITNYVRSMESSFGRDWPMRFEKSTEFRDALKAYWDATYDALAKHTGVE